MQKRLVGALALVALAGAVMLFVIHHNKARAPAVRVIVEDAGVRNSAVLVCVHCKMEFPLREGIPISGTQGLVLCPKCGKPTPLSSRKVSR